MLLLYITTLAQDNQFILSLILSETLETFRFKGLVSSDRT